MAQRRVRHADIALGEIAGNAGHRRLPGVRTKNERAYTVPLAALGLDGGAGAIWPPAGITGSYRLLGQIKGGGFRNFSVLKTADRPI